MADEADRRASQRMPVVAGTTCSFVAPILDDVGPAKIRDVSVDGIGLILMKRVEVGASLAVGLSHPERGFTKTLVVKVAHVTPIPGGYLVGGTFTPQLTYQELTSLVM
jgi:hypothetical protein